MSLTVDISTDSIRVPLSGARIADAARAALRAERVRHALISITFLNSNAIARINLRHLGRRGATDVIAFGFTRAFEHDPVVGDVYIAPEVARANARGHGVGVREELIRLVVHGTLHVLGYEHPEGDSRTRSPMWKQQESVVRRLLRKAG